MGRAFQGGIYELGKRNTFTHITLQQCAIWADRP